MSRGIQSVNSGTKSGVCVVGAGPSSSTRSITANGIDYLTAALVFEKEIAAQTEMGGMDVG